MVHVILAKGNTPSNKAFTIAQTRTTPAKQALLFITALTEITLSYSIFATS